MTYTSNWFCQTELMKEETFESTEVGKHHVHIGSEREGRENIQYKNSEARVRQAFYLDQVILEPESRETWN